MNTDEYETKTASSLHGDALPCWTSSTSSSSGSLPITLPCSNGGSMPSSSSSSNGAFKCKWRDYHCLPLLKECRDPCVPLECVLWMGSLGVGRLNRQARVLYENWRRENPRVRKKGSAKISLRVQHARAVAAKKKRSVPNRARGKRKTSRTSERANKNATSPAHHAAECVWDGGIINFQ